MKMTNKELEKILKSPITKAAKGRFISIEQLEQIKTILEAWEVVKRYTDTSEDIVNTEYYFIKGLDDEFETLKKALELEDD